MMPPDCHVMILLAAAGAGNGPAADLPASAGMTAPAINVLVPLVGLLLLGLSIVPSIVGWRRGHAKLGGVIAWNALAIVLTVIGFTLLAKLGDLSRSSAASRHQLEVGGIAVGLLFVAFGSWVCALTWSIVGLRKPKDRVLAASSPPSERSG